MVGDYNSADQCFASGFEIAATEDKRQLEALITAGLAKNLMFRGQYTAAIACFKEALAIFEELAYPFYSAITRSELATNRYLHLDESEKALDLFQKAEQVSSWRKNASAPPRSLHR